jgi:hypothetical protein
MPTTHDHTGVADIGVKKVESVAIYLRNLTQFGKSLRRLTIGTHRVESPRIGGDLVLEIGLIDTAVQKCQVVGRMALLLFEKVVVEAVSIQRGRGGLGNDRVG